MNMIDAIAAEYQQETATTRKTLERVPDAKLGWKPHETSMGFGQLASHIADTQGWTQSILEQDEFDIPPGYKGFEGKTTADIVKQFDKNVAASLAAMKKGVSNETLMKPWSLKQNGKTMFSMPKIAVLRVFVLSHQIHHRGQLSVYLRMNGAKVPSIYGPSGDER